MSLVKSEMATQTNGTRNEAHGDLSFQNDRLKLDGPNNTQLMQPNGSHSDADELSRDYSAPQSSFSMPKQIAALDKSHGALADFFSTEVFQIVLHNPATAHRLLKFSQARMCGENMEFLERVRNLSTSGEEVYW